VGRPVPSFEAYLEPGTTPSAQLLPYLAAYRDLVTLAQPFMTRYPLIVGEGNLGNIDGDPPADPAFTRCSLTPFGVSVLDGIAPHLLANGANALVDGARVSFLPHNLAEIVAAARRLLTTPHLSDAELAEALPGPDFPTHGQITADVARAIYASGRGELEVAGSVHIEVSSGERCPVITALPFCVSKRRLLEQLTNAIGSGSLPGVVDVEDLSDVATNVRVVIHLENEADPERCAEAILRQTPLSTQLKVEMAATVDGIERLVTLPELLRAWVRQLETSLQARGSNPTADNLLHELDHWLTTHGDARRTRFARP
jgi:DNA gyrase subunit A